MPRPRDGAGLTMLRIVRVLAPNPSVYTLEGTNTWIVGDGAVDRDRPGARRRRRISRRSRARAGEVGAVLVTHDHEDHARGRGRVRASASARRCTRGGSPGASSLRDGAGRSRPAASSSRPCTRPGTAPTTSSSSSRPQGRCSRATPCWAAGRASSIRPRATSRSTCASLHAHAGAATRARSTRVTVRSCCDAAAKLAEYLDHRAEREEQVLAGLEAGDRTVARLVERIYADYPAEVHALAARSVIAHLLKLQPEGRVRKRGPRRARRRGCASRAGGVRALRQAGARPSPLLPVVLARTAAGRRDRIALAASGRPAAAASARRSGRAPATRSRRARTIAGNARFADLPRGADHRGELVLGERGRGSGRAAGRRAAEPRREVEQPPLDPLGDAEPGELARDRVAPRPCAASAWTAARRDRPQARRPQRRAVSRRGSPSGRAERVARPEHVDQERSALGVDDARREQPDLDRPQAGAGLALPHRASGRSGRRRGGVVRRRPPGERPSAPPARTVAACTDTGDGRTRLGFAHARGKDRVATTKLEAVLAYVPLFRGLTKRQLKHLAGLCEVADYMADATIVREGTTGDAFYVVLKGQANVTMNEHFLERLVPGDHFGEIAALDGGARSATVTSETPVTLAVMSRKSLLKALRDDPELSLTLMAELARMIRRATRNSTSSRAARAQRCPPGSLVA